MSIVCPFCASSRSFLSCRFYAVERRDRKPWEMESHVCSGKWIHTSSSCLFALFFSPSASCFCSAARARESRTSSSLERITHSKCRSRSAYRRRTSFRRSRILEKYQCLSWRTKVVLVKTLNLHSVEDFFDGALRSLNQLYEYCAKKKAISKDLRTPVGLPSNSFSALPAVA